MEASSTRSIPLCVITSDLRYKYLLLIYIDEHIHTHTHIYGRTYTFFNVNRIIDLINRNTCFQRRYAFMKKITYYILYLFIFTKGLENNCIICLITYLIHTHKHVHTERN